jgi:hypothetical protein
MGGKPGRSGPPLNTNAVRHPWRSFWKRLALKDEHKSVGLALVKYENALLRDKPDATEGERRTIELACEAKAARLLIWEALEGEGFTRRGIDGLALMPAAEALPKFIGAELGALKLLGLERRAKPVQSLTEYLTQGGRPVEMLHEGE